MSNRNNIEETPITQILSTNFIDYSMSVIVSRAIPDVRDGLKPVHRRILWAMKTLGMNYNRPFKKSARIVGEVIGKYHPHGDTAVYESMVRLAQGWNVRTPLIDGQGNFGSIDGDRAAAMRYTEARLKKAAHDLLRGITDENGKLTGVVDFVPNFDGEEKEPSVLPARLPNLLINGSEGIAVGMATKMAPHNLKEVCEGIIAQMENPDITVEELMEYVKGPDFPTGGIILGDQGIKDAYETGRGSVLIRGVIEQDIIDGRDALIIKEVPYQVNKKNLITAIKKIQLDYNEYKNELKKSKTKVVQKGLDFIHDIRDETDEDNIYDVRIVIELKNGTNPDLVINHLYKNTALQTSFSIINLALVPKKYGNNQQRLEPQVLGLKGLISEYIKHQQEVLSRSLNHDLKEKEAEMHKLTGIMKALAKLDETIELIRNSKEEDKTIEELKSLLDIDDLQAQQILGLRLKRLANYEQDKLKTTHTELGLQIEEIKSILASEEKLNQLIIEDLKQMIQEYGEGRRSRLAPAVGSINEEDLVENIPVVITLTDNGLIKRMPESTYRSQRRNGRGVNGMNTFEDDSVKHIQISNNLDTIMFFTNLGNVYKTKAYQIPMTSPQSKGVSLKSIFDLNPNEEVQSILSIQKFTDLQYVVFGTKNGFSKRTKLSEYADSRRNGIRAITFKDESDEVMHVGLTSGDKKITVVTRKGQSITFKEEDVKVVKRNAGGVKVITLDSDDKVVSMAIHNGFSNLFMATTKGFGKRTKLSEFRLQKRAGKGVRAISTNDKNGYVIGCCVVEDDENLLLLTKNGIIIKLKVSEISTFGRNAQGTKLINLKGDDELQALDRNSDEDNDTDNTNVIENEDVEEIENNED